MDAQDRLLERQRRRHLALLQVERERRPFRNFVKAFVVVTLVMALPMAGFYFLSSKAEESVPGNTIVKVTGSKQTGFEVTYRDGAGAGYPPLSNARKDCEKDDLCLIAVQVEYEWLSRMRDAL